jgi:hypothetical protein
MELEPRTDQQEVTETTMSRRSCERVQRLLGSPVIGTRRVRGGYTPARRWVVALADGRRVFVKEAVDEAVVPRLRREHSVYEHLHGSWRPELLGFEDGERPLLILEDLSSCAWPPPWNAERIKAVRAALVEVAVHAPPPGLAPVSTLGFTDDGGWPEVARDPEPFLNLGLCSRSWLADAFPALLDAADPRLLEGDALCHLDVRSDNLCFREDGQAILIDWDCAGIGNPEFDLAFWLPSLHLEGGPPPQAVAECTPGIVAIVAGFFASQAGLPNIPFAPRVRDIQLKQLKVALPWVAHVLRLPPPDRQPHAR